MEENELFGEAHEQEENGLFGRRHEAEQLHKLLQYLSDEDELIGNRTHQQIIDNFKKPEL